MYYICLRTYLNVHVCCALYVSLFLKIHMHKHYMILVPNTAILISWKKWSEIVYDVYLSPCWYQSKKTDTDSPLLMIYNLDWNLGCWAKWCKAICHVFAQSTLLVMIVKLSQLRNTGCLREMGKVLDSLIQDTRVGKVLPPHPPGPQAQWPTYLCYFFQLLTRSSLCEVLSLLYTKAT